MNERPELFLLSWDVVDACGQEEINATYEDMKKIGIANMPYSLVDVHVQLRLSKTQLDAMEGKSGPFTIEFEKPGSNRPSESIEAKFSYRDGECYRVLMRNVNLERWVDLTKNFSCSCPSCRRDWLNIGDEALRQHGAEKFKKILIVLLATKNVVKTRTKNKLLALGIGKHKKDNNHPLYTTTLSLPLEFTLTVGSNNPPVQHTGVTLRPHLRRGHVTHQRHGPRNQYVKAIWIQPLFVNADEHYVPTRVNYNVSMKCEGMTNENG